MASLKHCISIHSVPKPIADHITREAKAYRAEGVDGATATIRAVKDYIKIVEAQRLDVIGQINAAIEKDYPELLQQAVQMAAVIEPAKNIDEDRQLDAVVEGKAGQQSVSASDPTTTEERPGQAAPPALPKPTAETISATPGSTAPEDATPIAVEGAQKQVESGGKIEDFGEKIGGARKDTAEVSDSRGKRAKADESSPSWKKRFVVAESVKVPGQFSIIDTKGGRFSFSSGAQTFATKEEAESAIPVYAVAKTHQVVQSADTTWNIYKRVGDRKRIKVVERDFPSREDALRHMAENAVQLLESKTSFGEEILPIPEIAVRRGDERRTAPATPEMFMETFAPRGIEFGNWTNQDERQQVMDHAYDGLLDLAEILGVPPKALMLNGELAIAFGARGQGLVGAKAHYERDYGVINLTKMKGAGSLAHEWFHAFDHYLGRLDGKAKSDKETNKRGDQVYKTKGTGDYLSHGASYRSQMREELRAAYESLVKAMYKKAEQYVDDTAKAEKFLGTARENLKESLDRIRADLSRDLVKEYTWRKSKKGLAPASAEQLAEFDRMASILIEGGDLATAFRADNPTAPANSRAAFSGRATNDTLEGISRILKAVRNRSGFNAERTGTLDRLRVDMTLYNERLKMLREATAGTEKTKQVPTSYAMEARKMDQARTGEYWSLPHEMAARAFAAYVEDKVADQGGQSDFLVYQAHGGIIVPMIDGFVARPYPEGREREALNAAFDEFVKSIRTEETEKGVVMFALRPDMSSKEALPILVERGQREFSPGMKYAEFARRMKVAMGDMWERFKGLMLKVWNDVRGKFAEERGSFNYREMKVPVNKKLFERVGVEQGNIFADYIRLQEKHPEYFATPEDVRQHVEFVIENPGEILPASKNEYTLLVRSDGKDRATVVEFVRRGGKYRVRSAYILEAGQLEVKKQKALSAVSKPVPPENLVENITEGGGVPSDTLRAEPLSENTISFSEKGVKYAVAQGVSGLPAADIRTAFEPVYRNMPQAPPWRVVDTAAELPKRALADAARRGIPQQMLQAVYLGDEVVYVAENFRSIEEAKQVILEEVVVHHGLRGVMDKAAYEKHMLQAAIWYANKRPEQWKQLASTYGLDVKSRAGRIEAAEEMLGRDAREGKDSTMFSRIVAAVKEYLRQIGFDLGYGEAEIRELLGKARRFVEGKEQGAGNKGQGTGIDYGALLRKLREQGITDEQLMAVANYQSGGELTRFALARLQDVKGQIVDKGVSLGTAEREVLEADKGKALEAIGETVRDYDEPGRYVFRAFYEDDQQHSPEVVPYNPERGHYAAGEELKGSWWTTSYKTAQEIAWSKARDGRTVKIVALPVEKLPGKVYIQNTNPAGSIYDLFVGLPADVAMADVQEMPVTAGIRYALRDDLVQFAENWGSRDMRRDLFRLLNPFDWSRITSWFGDFAPAHFKNALINVLRDPIGAAEVDDDKKPFVETGLERERNKTNILLRIFGWDGPKSEVPGFVDRLKRTFTTWGNHDLTTAWGRIADAYQKLGAKERTGVDWLLYRGDLDGKVYRTYDMVKDDARVATKLPSEEAFKVYQQIRTHMDTTVADVVVEKMQESMARLGATAEDIDKHITTFRQRLAQLPGWVPRNHGEGDWQVNVYQKITGLKWETGQFKETRHVKYVTKDGNTVEFEQNIDALSALLPYFPSKDVAMEIRKLAKRYGLKYEQLSKGGQRVYVDKGAAERIAKSIAALERKLEGKKLSAEEKETLEQKLSDLKTTQVFVRGSSEQEQIRYFIKKSSEILTRIQDKNQMAIHRAKEQVRQAKEDNEPDVEIKRLEDELRRLGDGSVKVKMYMKLKGTRAQADKHRDEVLADLHKAMPETYLDSAQYDVTVAFNDQLSESMFGDMQNDFATEQAQLKAIEKAAAHQEISKETAAAVRRKILQSTAEVLLGRGAGAHRIRRAEYLIEGYENENPVEGFQDYMTGTAGMISKAEYAAAQFENYRYAKPPVKAWAEKYIKDTLRNMGATDRLSGNLRSLATLSFLGFKVSSMVINATQPWVMGVAELGRHTRHSPVKAMLKAQKDIMLGKLTEREKLIFASEIFKEQEQRTAVHEMSGTNEGATGKASQFVRTLTDKALFGFQEVEMLNRKTMILAAWRTFRADNFGADGTERNKSQLSAKRHDESLEKALKKALEMKDATQRSAAIGKIFEKDEELQKALEVNRQVNNEMSRANLPGFAQKPLGRTIYALQSFMFRSWNWVYNRLTSGQKEDMVALLRYGAAIMVIGGAAALPGADELDKLYQRLFGESPKHAFKQWTGKHARNYGTLGDMIHGFAWHGATSATGVNISNAIRLQIPIVSPLIDGDSLPEAGGGVFTGLMQKGTRAVTAASRGDMYRALENISPEALAGAMRAYRMATKGATTGTGKIIFDENGRQMKYSAGDAAKRMFGFQSSRVAERNEVTNVEMGLSSFWKDERGELLSELRLASPGERRAVLQRIVEYNRRLRGSQAAGLVSPIKAETIKQALSNRPNKRKAAWQQNQLTS